MKHVRKPKINSKSVSYPQPASFFSIEKMEQTVQHACVALEILPLIMRKEARKAGRIIEAKK